MGLKSWIGSFFSRKKVGQTTQKAPLLGQITAQDQEKAAQRKARLRLEHEILMLELEKKKARLEQDLYDLRGDEDEGPDRVFMQLITTALTGSQIKINSGPGIIPNPPPTDNPGQGITIDQLEELWIRLPEGQRKLIKLASDDNIRKYIKNNYPSLPTEDIEKIIVFVKEVAP